MDENGKTPQKNYSVEEILAEARIIQKNGKAPSSSPASVPDSSSSPEPKPAPGRSRNRPPDREEILKGARRALNMEADAEQGAGEEDAGEPDGAAPPEPEKKRKKHWFSRFGRKKKEEKFREEDDLYYGLQLRPLEEYRKEYEKTIRPEDEPDGGGAEESSFPYLFDGKEDSGPDLTETFDRIHRERHKRLEKIMQQAGLDPDEILPQEESARPPEQPSAPGRTAPQPGEPGGPALNPGPQREPEPPRPGTSAPRPEKPGGPALNPGPQREPEPPRPGTSVPQPEKPGGPALNPGPQREPEPLRPGTSAPQPGEPEITAGGTRAGGSIPEKSSADAESPSRSPAESPEGPSAPPENKSPEKAEETPPAPVKEPLGTPPQAKREPRVSPPCTEPPENRKPQYRAARVPVHVVRPLELHEILMAEAADYPLPEPPKPIPFPKKSGEAPSGPGKTVEAEKKPVRQAQKPEEPEPERDKRPDGLKSPEHQTASGRPGGEKPSPAPEAETAETKAAPADPARRRFRLFGSEEAPEEAEVPPPAEREEELDDYTDPSDAPSVRHDLLKNVTRLALRLAVTGVASLVLLLVGLLAEHPALLPPELHTALSGPSYPVIQLIFLLVAAGFNAPTFANGFKGLASFQANSDSAVAVAVLAALIQNVALLFLGSPGGVSLYSPIAAAALFLNTAGKLSMSRRIFFNFRYLCTKEQKYAVRLYDDYNTSLRLAKDCVLGEPRIAYQSKTSFLRNFLRISYTPDPADHLSQVLAPVGFLLSLALCAGCAFLSGGAAEAVTAFTASCCVCVPFANLLCVNLPVSRLCGIARKRGSMVAGWAAVDQFGATNAVMLDAQDLFPRGTVILNGIRTFGGQRIDDAILDAAALMCTVGGPLSDLFDQIIKNRREILPKIEEPSYEDGKGVAGTVSGRKILVGNRDLMKAHGIEPPSHDYEEKYIRGGNRLVYLASGDNLVAMFLVSYRSDLRRAQDLRRIERSGISLIVRTRDPNITPRFLAECFGLYEQEITVLPEQLGGVYADLVSAPPDRADAVIATRGRPFAMLRLLAGCVRQRGNVSVAVALQAAAVALGFALVAFLSLYSGLKQLSVASLTAYEAFWTAAILLVPRIRKP